MNRSILIYGFNKSGRASFNLIYNSRDKFFILDEDKSKQISLLNEFEFYLNVFVLKQINIDFIDGVDEIIVSPGIDSNNKYLLYARKKHIKILPEIELASQYSKGKIIAITGTNGKTTTTNLIYNIFSQAKKRVEKVGNIGIPFSEKVKIAKRNTYYICEVSSFQLESITHFKPNISCLLNITPDHLDRHKTFENYKKIKYKIFNNLDKNGIAIINDSLKLSKKDIKIFYFGNNKHKFGCYLDKDFIIYSNGKTKERICNINELQLRGEHNLQNIMCAIIVSKLSKIKTKHIIYSLQNFKGNKHRIEEVYKINNITFIDDSKATNVDATINAIKTLCKDKSTYLILGGSNKGDNFDNLFSMLPDNIVKILVIGETKNIIINSSKNTKFEKRIIKFNNLKEATQYACIYLKEFEQLLLSPACASLDQFKNYADRGEKFLEYIKDYYEK